MRTVDSLISVLEKFPKKATCNAYEGERIGLVIHKDGRQLGIILCTSSDEPDNTVELRESDGVYIYKDEELLTQLSPG